MSFKLARKIVARLDNGSASRCSRSKPAVGGLSFETCGAKIHAVVVASQQEFMNPKRSDGQAGFDMSNGTSHYAGS